MPELDMRVVAVILLSVVVLFISTQDTFMMLIFKMNQHHIAEHHCENRDNPDMDCNGTCFLKKQLDEAHDHQNEDTIPFTYTEKTNLLFVTPMPENAPLHQPNIRYFPTDRNNFHYKLIWASRLFRPPIS